jgi:hypothetical protein
MVPLDGSPLSASVLPQVAQLARPYAADVSVISDIEGSELELLHPGSGLLAFESLARALRARCRATWATK